MIAYQIALIILLIAFVVVNIIRTVVNIKLIKIYKAKQEDNHDR